MKKFLIALFGIFLLAGGMLFSACSKEAPQAIINVSSTDFAAEDYVEIDLNSNRPFAEIHATVENVSSGMVTANNNTEGVISTSTVYDATQNTTKITIAGVSEGNGLVELKSYEGDGTKLIKVYVYSDILGMSQKTNAEGEVSDQYVIRSEVDENLVNVLDPERYINFVSREGGESNRKDVTWSFTPEQQNNLTGLVLDGNNLIVQNGYVGDQVSLIANSVYTDFSAVVTVDVLKQLPSPVLTFSRSENANFIDYDESVHSNLVKNDQSKDESKLYVKIVVDAEKELIVNPIVKNSNGEVVTNKLTITQFSKNTTSNGMTEIIYLIEAENSNADVETLNIHFEVSYKDYNYSKSTNEFSVKLVDVIDSISVVSAGQNVTNGDVLDVYNNYNGDGNDNYGRPFVVSLGPSTVANDKATFVIRMDENPSGNFVIYMSRPNESAYIQNNFSQVVIDGKVYYQSQPIENGSNLYFKATGTFVNGQICNVGFYSTQSENICLNFNLRKYFAPNDNFNFAPGVNTTYFISTNELNQIEISFMLEDLNLSDISNGLYLEATNSSGGVNDNFSVGELSFEGQTAKFVVSNTKTNINSDNLVIRVKHKNGFQSTASISVQAFVPLTNAELSYQGNSTNAVSQSSNGYQTSGQITSFTLQELILKSGNSVLMNIITNNNVTLKNNTYTFEFFKTNEKIVSQNDVTSLVNYLRANFEVDQGESGVSFVKTTNRLTVSNDVKGYAVFTFVGYDANHQEIKVERIFYLEGYTAPTSLRANPTSVSLIAKDSISTEDASLAQNSVSVLFRLDGQAITYFDKTNFSFSSSTDNDVNLEEEGFNYQIANVFVTGQTINFDIFAKTTGGYKTFIDSLVVKYSAFNFTYSTTIQILITNATRVENVVWENKTSDGEIYLDLYSTEQTAKQFNIITSISPLDAYNDDLTYIFVANSGTEKDIISINDLGIVSLKNNLSKGGTGYIYVLPSDAIRLVQGREQIVYLTTSSGKEELKSVPISDISTKYDEIINGYFIADKTDEDARAVYYSSIILKIKVTVADGRSEETAIRIYNAGQFAEIDPNLHYVLMNSITLEDWVSFDKDLTGSLKGYDENTSIFLKGEPLFNQIGEGGKVENLILSGEVQGGGFVANINNGSIQNITITMFNTANSDGGQIINMSKVTGGVEQTDGEQTDVFAGAIVGVNNGQIGKLDDEESTSEIRVEGVNIGLSDVSSDETTTYAGMFVGKNNGKVYNTYGEFYTFEINQINTITADYVGGFAGHITTNGYFEHCYVYNYTSEAVLNATTKGAFVGQVESYVESYIVGISNSFAIVGEMLNVAGEGNLDLKDYYTDGTDESISDQTLWVTSGDANYQSYVRGESEPHLKFYQSQALQNFGNIKVQTTEKSLPVANGESGILFLHKLENTIGLSSAGSAALTNLNTISFTELFGEDAGNILVSSSNKNVAEVVGKSIIIKEVGDVTFTVTSKQNMTLSTPFEFKVLYVLSNFDVKYNGVSTSGFDLQEGKTANITFEIKSSVYLANETSPRSIKLQSFKLTEIVDSNKTIQSLVTYSTNGMIGTIAFSKGLTEALEEAGKSYVTIKSAINVDSLEGEELTDYQNAIQSAFSKSLNITPFKGSNEILSNVESIKIEPSIVAKINVTLFTDSESDGLVLGLNKNVNKNGVPLTFGAQNNGVTKLTIDRKVVSTEVYFAEAVFDLTVARGDFNTDNSSYSYVLTFSISKDYKSEISENEIYNLVLSSVSGTSKDEGKTIELIATSQKINYVDIANYEAGRVSNVGGTIVYQKEDTAVSVLSPGKASFMEIVVDPEYAYYDYMTLTYQASDNSSLLTITKMTEFDSADVIGYKVDYSSGVSNVINGIKVSRSASQNGQYVFRLYVSANITSDVIFTITASFYDANGKLINSSKNYQLFVSYLPQAEILVDGTSEAIIAKGGSAELTILLQQDQELDSLVAVGAVGVTISPKETWKVEEFDNGTKLYTAIMRASLDASLTEGVNGTFEVEAKVSRYLNGEYEEKNSVAYVTIVDFKPVSASLSGAQYNAQNNTYMFTNYIGITNALTFNYTFSPESYAYDASNTEEIGLVEDLLEARELFQNQGYYIDETSGFSINYKNGEAIPVYERLEINGSPITFTKSSDHVYTYSNARFRLTYTETTDSEGAVTGGHLTVTGLMTTTSPVYITLVDQIRINSSGENVLYEIETNFAISVTIHSDLDKPLIIQTAEDFLNVASEGQAEDYILLNDITLQNYTPIDSTNFRSLDGNGYSINIESFNVTGSGTLNLALFNNISSNSIIKNLRVNIYQRQAINVDVTSSGYSSINIAGLAINNAGTVTNCQVVSYKNSDSSFTNSGDLGLTVNYMRGSDLYYIDSNSTISSQVAGFVINNTGSITNSKVGGEEIIIIGEQIAGSDIFDYSTEKLSTFNIIAQGTVAGFVITNSGDIASSAVSQAQISNLASSDASQTSGFVITNSGDIRISAVQGVAKDDTDTYHRTGSNISAVGTVAGFVVRNTETATISDGYSNILISDASTLNSLTSAGFVYQNEGKIETSYAASYVEKANARQLSFSGVDANGNSLNTGSIELSYYYIADYDDDEASDVQGALDSANLISRDEVENQNAYYGFIFNSSDESTDGVWKLVSGKGVEPVSLSSKTISHRYYVAGTDGDYLLPYSILKDQDDSLAEVYNTAYGEDINPILIASAKEFKEAMGDSTSTYLNMQFNETEIFGAYRLVSDIDLSELNNAIGNAEVKSVDKIFEGVIDGNGFTINNISLSSNNNSVGLFGEARNALIQNLNIEIESVTAGSSVAVGGLVGLVKDSRIINISMTQKNQSSTTSDEQGILGRNVTGGILGAVFGDSQIVGLSVSGAMVQSNYYDSATTITKDKVYTRGDSWSFDKNAVRKYADENSNDLFGDKGLGEVSFAGGVVGYIDIYSDSQYSQKTYNYVTNLTNSDYQVNNIRVTDSIDVRAEIVGGAIGFTGNQTRTQDVGIYVTNIENSFTNILSYNFLSGGLIGLGNGDFYQIFAQYEEDLQNEIESSTYLYYQTGSDSAERGLTNIFEKKSNDTGEQDYKPMYVGGLFGALESGHVYVAYNKLNVINPNRGDNVINPNRGGYAGGIAGVVFASSQFLIDNPISTDSMQATSHLFNEVYTSGDVYAFGVADGKATNFGGLFGKILANTKISMAAVNVVSEFGILGEGYVSDENPMGISVINALAGEISDSATVFVYPVSASGENLSEEIGEVKSFGYMATYTARGKTINVESGITKSETDDSDADYVFKIPSVSEFSSPENGYTETNGAFINSNAWSSDNWIHETNKLYPTINLVNAVTYIYLDQDNKDTVVSKMQNSSIEVRVRGRHIDENTGAITYGYVDLSGYEISNFTGRLIGATDNSWFDNKGTFVATTVNDISSSDVMGNNYPGIIVSNTLFVDCGTGANFQNLNLIFKTSDETNSVFTSGTLQDVKFSNINAWFTYSVTINVEKANDGNLYGGLFASNARSTSFENMMLYFSSQDTAGDAIINFSVSVDEGVQLENSNASFGLLVGNLVQDSAFDSLKINNITIKHNNLESSPLMQVSLNGKYPENVYAGLYVGNLSNDQNVESSAGVMIRATTPQSIEEINDQFNINVILTTTANSKINSNINFGGLFGKISTTNTNFTFSESDTYNKLLKLTISANQESGKALTLGGLVGDATLSKFSYVGEEQSKLNFELSTGSYGDGSIGLLFGKIETSTNLTLSGGTISGTISQTSNPTNTNGETPTKISATSAKIGGIVGTNEGGTIHIDSMGVSLKVHKGSEEDFTTADFTSVSDETGLYSASELNLGGIVGLNNGTIAVGENGNVTFNKAGENILVSSPTLNVGSVVGQNQSSSSVTISSRVTIKEFSSSSIYSLWGDPGNAESESGVNAGGAIGFDLSSTSISGGTSASAKEINFADTFFISSKTINAGGVIGKLGNSSTATATAEIENTSFSGAFKIYGAKANSGNHTIGGIVGIVYGTATITSNKTYGDVIYTYTTGDNNNFVCLNSYVFGGVIGDVRSGSATVTKNIVALTNNNQGRGTKTHQVDAMVGNSNIQVTYKTTDDPTPNYYSSQLVLATSDNAVDLNYTNTATKGYSPNGESYQADGSTTIIKELFGANYGEKGTKFNPITEGDVAKTEGDNPVPITTNGIQYYTGKYPSYISSTETDPKPEAYAFIGDWQKQTSAIDSLSQHSFVSGVYTELSVLDTSSSDTNSSRDGKASGGIVNTMTGGIVYACISSGTLSVGGTSAVNLGGIVGLMTSGYINDCSSSLDIVYRAAKDGTASGIATSKQDTNQFNRIYVNNTYSTGKVTSYIDANLYSFTNGLSEENANFYITNSYTISRVDWNDYTSEATSAGYTLGVTGFAQTPANFDYDPNAIGDAYSSKSALSSTSWIYPASYVGDATDSWDTDNNWVTNCDVNYGYPVRNFAKFKAFTTIEKIDSQEYQLVPNVTKLVQAGGTNLNYKLIDDIDFDNTSFNKENSETDPTIKNPWTSLDFTNVADFDGDGHTISNLKGKTLIDTVQNISNLRVTDAALNAQAVVALHVTGNATNVIATGTLTVDGDTDFADAPSDGSNASFKDTSVGGLFAIADGTISSCKNYVHIDVEKDGLDGGGIVGRAVGSITNCFNYSPINAVSAYDNVNDSGGNVGGIVGGFAGSSITNCGNENTVFNGYTITSTDDTDNIRDGSYTAAGIVGCVNGSSSNDSSIENCYNTSMIKAGNKGINANGNNKAYAAGIVASLSNAEVSGCVNIGFIEALGGSPQTLANSTAEKVGNNWQLTLSYNTDNKINVVVDEIYISSDTTNNEANQMGGQTFKNGLYGSWTKSCTYQNSTTGLYNHAFGYSGTTFIDTSKTDKGNINGITISTSGLTSYISSVDQLGAPNGGFISATRSINYGAENKVSRSQIIYVPTSYINESETYYACAVSENTSNRDSAVNAIKNLLATNGDNESDNSNYTNVAIAGKLYAFVNNGSQFISAISSDIYSATFKYGGNFNSDLTIDQLVEEGYVFSVCEVKAYKDQNCTQEASTVSILYTSATYGNGKVDVLIKYSNENSNNSIYYKYDLVATKNKTIETITLQASNLLKNDADKSVSIVNISRLENGMNFVNGQKYTVGNYKFTYSSSYDNLIYTGDDYISVFNSLNNQTININVNENVTTTVTIVSSISDSSEIVKENISINQSEIIKTSGSLIVGVEERTLVSPVFVDFDSRATKNPANESYVESANINKSESLGSDYRTLVETIVLKGHVKSFTLKDNGDNLDFNDITLSEGQTINVGLTFGGLGTTPGIIEITQFSYDSVNDKTTIVVRAHANSPYYFGSAAQNDFAKLNFTFNFYKTYTFSNEANFNDLFNQVSGEKDEIEMVSAVMGKSTNRSVLVTNSNGSYYYEQTYDKINSIEFTIKDNKFAEYSYNGEIKTPDAGKISFANINSTTSLSISKTMNPAEDEFAIYTYTYDTTSNTFGIDIDVKDNKTVAYSIGGVTKAVNASADNKKLSFSGFVSLESLMRLNIVNSSDDSEISYLVDVNNNLTGLSIAVKNNFSGIYSINQNNVTTRKAVTSNSKERNIEFNITTLQGLTIAKEIIDNSTKTSIDLTRPDQAHRDGDVVNVIVNEMVPYLIDEEITEVILTSDGKFEYAGATHNVVVEGEEIKTIDGQTCLQDNVFIINGQTFMIDLNINEDANNTLELLKVYVGDGGLIKIDDSNFITYYVNNQSTGEYKVDYYLNSVPISVSNNYLTIGDKSLLVRENLITKSGNYSIVSTEGSNNYTINGDFGNYDIVTLEVETLATPINQSLELNSYIYSINAPTENNFIESKKVIIDNEETIIDEYSAFGPYENETLINVETSYKEFTVKLESNGSTTEEGNKEKYGCIVLTADINVGYLGSPIVGFNNIAANGKIINFGSTFGAFLNSEGTKDSFIKDLGIAGSVVDANENVVERQAGILALSLNSGVINVTTYGTINVGQIGAVSAGGIAQELTGKISNVKNFASLSNFVKDGYAENSTIEMAGIAWDITTSSQIEAYNYGTIIGLRGADGENKMPRRFTSTSAAENGGDAYDGQNVYAISSSTISNPKNVTNHGIVIAGNGGNGGRGADGSGGRDNQDESAPLSGTYGGDGGCAGEAGTAYLYGPPAATTDEDTSSSNILSTGNNGADGVAGNNGWGGLNLYKYSITNTPVDDYAHNWKTTWNSVYENATCSNNNASRANRLKIYCDLYFDRDYNNEIIYANSDDVNSDGLLVGNAGSIWFKIYNYRGPAGGYVNIVNPEDTIISAEKIYWYKIGYHKIWTGGKHSVGLNGDGEKSFYYVGSPTSSIISEYTISS